MAKKKKSWKSAALQNAKKTKEDKLRESFIQIVNGESPLLRRPDDLYEFLNSSLDDIEDCKNPKVQLELLAWFLRTDFIIYKCKEEEKEYWENLYFDGATFFVELASPYEDKEYVANLVHDLAIRHVGGAGRSTVFLSIAEFLPHVFYKKLIEELLLEVEELEEENKDDVLDAICDMADSTKDTANFVKASLLKDPEKSNATLIDIANTYYMAEDLPLAKQWLKDVKNPGAEDEEAYLDLMAAIAYKEGKTEECLKYARTLYEKYPKIINLGRYVAFLPQEEASQVLLEHEKYRSGTTVDLEFMMLLASMKCFQQLSLYVTRFEKELTTLDAESLNQLADNLEKDNEKELAKHIRDWIVEEPEEVEF